MCRLFTVIALIAGLSGCMSMPLTSMYKLSKINPLEAKPEDIRIAIRTLDIVSIEKGMVQMRIAYTADDDSIRFDHTYLVEVIQNDLLSKVLLDTKQPNEVVTVMHLSAEDATQMLHWQQQIREYKQRGGEGTGTFTIGVSDTCLLERLPEDELEVDIFIQVDSQDGYFVMFEDMDLLDLEEAEALSEMRLCSELNSN